MIIRGQACIRGGVQGGIMMTKDPHGIVDYIICLRCSTNRVDMTLLDHIDVLNQIPMI